MAGENNASFYDAANVHRRYTDHRHGERHLSPNHVMEEPAVLAEVGDPAGLRILDLGCGDGEFGRRMLTAGAAGYLGIDSSSRMIDTARTTLTGTAGRVLLADIDDITPPPDSVDLITARLSLHYVADLERVMTVAAQTLTTGGRFILTVVHPVITSYDNKPPGPRTNWIVDDYFHPGPRQREWLGAVVTWHHRTVEDYVMAATRARLSVTALRECRPDPTRFDGHAAELERRQRVPLFLLLNLRVRP